ncbi:PhzF family phenazine biosynthesis protein [Synechococcus sp. Nb3U1]|uniref:PhzF family phenazine biosynthesis protein n=1 Tax=Synechococcus sp. Nb3U1 TaxID=1914529 RepID=UPI002285A0BF|nr:PhzF family phenazine biosynthesis protein [Synechococcus sp. Nb3U1]
MNSVRIPFFQVDAFTQKPFAGNPAAVCLLTKDGLAEPLMQQIAAENNLSETAFLLPQGSQGTILHYGLRWFTPTTEVDLCGHATLASAHVLLTQVDPQAEAVEFSTRSGLLRVRRLGERLVMDFPAQPVEPWPEALESVAAALGVVPRELYRGGMGLAVLDSPQQVGQLQPDMAKIQALASTGLVVTAPGEEQDFVSRFFAPQLGIPEDPVTGAAHCLLIPYWAKRLGRSELTARQVSARGGELLGRDLGSRVEIAGYAVLVIMGEMRLD